MAQVPPAEKKKEPSLGLLPALGLFSTTMFVVGAVIGSGIFVKPGLMATQLGSSSWLLAVWVIAGVVTMIGALVNAEVAAMIPQAGGQYVFFDRMYGSFPAYLYGWSVFAVMKTGALASLAFIFSRGVGQFVALPELPAHLAAWSVHLPLIGDIQPMANFGGKLLATGLIVALTAVNYFGVKLGSFVQNIFAVAKASALVLIIGVAFFAPRNGTAAAVVANPVTAVQGLALIGALAAAIQGAFWAYDGWNDVTYLAGEVKQPQSTLPRGLIVGMLIVMALYITTNIAYLTVLPISEMAGSKLVAADMVERCFTGGGKWIAIAVMISTFGAANGNVLAPARVFLAMARNNVFPALLGRIHPRYRTPATALIVQALWSILLVISGTFDTLTDMLVFVSWIFYAAGAAGIFVLRRTEPLTPRPYKVPGYPVLPIVFILFAICFLVLTVYNDTSSYLAALREGRPALNNSAFGVLLVLIGSPIYFLCKRRSMPGSP
jgi:basic amino acid/polyamine antiporter, APA family